MKPAPSTSAITAYLALALGVSTVAMLIGRSGLVAEPGWLATLAKFGPSIAGVVAVAVVSGRGGLRALANRLRPAWSDVLWYVGGVMVPALMVGLATLIATGGRPSLTGASGATIVAGELGRRIFFGGGLGEEIGWRGFLLPALAGRHSMLTAALLVGVAHGLWHLPANGVAGTILVTSVTVPWSVIMTWMVCRTDGRLWPVILAHGAGNGWIAATGRLVEGLGLGWYLAVIAFSWAGAYALMPRLRSFDGGAQWL